jgi:hypothetical protein
VLARLCLSESFDHCESFQHLPDGVSLKVLPVRFLSLPARLCLLKSYFSLFDLFAFRAGLCLLEPLRDCAVFFAPCRTMSLRGTDILFAGETPHRVIKSRFLNPVFDSR